VLQGQKKALPPNLWVDLPWSPGFRGKNRYCLLQLQLLWFCLAEPVKFDPSRFDRGFGVFSSYGILRTLLQPASNRGLTTQLAACFPVPESTAPLPHPPSSGSTSVHLVVLVRQRLF
jgi:hypothetical protein